MTLDGFADVGEVTPLRAGTVERAGGDWGAVTAQAGVRLRELNGRLAAQGWTLPALGSIDEQSLAGALATGTHGSALGRGAGGQGGGGGTLLEHVRALRIVLGNGEVVRAAPGGGTEELFRAALVSLGALGIVVEVEYAVRRDRRLRWTLSDMSLESMLAVWEHDLWTKAEFTRIWWLPYARRMIIWRADETADPPHTPPRSWLDGWVGHHVYAALLWVGHYVPSLLPTVEKFVFGMQYGFRAGSTTGTGVAPQRDALLMNCLYSQFVNEWALPLASGPEALRRLDEWIHSAGQGAYVHAPIEVRAADSSTMPRRALLDPGMPAGPTLYLNATLYRPRGLDPPCREAYYAHFEKLMAELGGRPHWAKNFEEPGPAFFATAYGGDMERWRAARREADPEGVFVGPWLRERVLGEEEGRMACEETFGGRMVAEGGGWMVVGDVGGMGKAGSVGSSVESFDVFARAEAEDGE
jgi:D-arabinono-1,4-lactone oxidase